ncbi:aminodeoxychorismate/anthranilate synthase component II [Thalassotalea sp. HSM 43]|uniref:aminodeoxychorismate/anthranilate synthase component II n=1 Tax=Thalassotalea sp. HSM 43 TaxID=2552945 RepID=UPI001081C70F|nr:aminodeoxychorismate/anthranilate synthase component II [Thalassotalea sp. HSM 43]QBY05334.1 aminodeoxychorismate/anthranilate synthase component II [Thalassotalea sp. HSM 43]
MTKLYMLDNLDSFTYNLVDEFKRLGYEPVIYRNNLDAQFIYDKMQQESDDVILVLSPGPGNPQNAGCLMALIDLCRGQYPILGICLGHQALVEHYGGKVDRAGEIVHGKASSIVHDGFGPFKGLPSPLPVARYHSLVATKMPDSLEVIAEYNELVMALAHQDDKVLGFQFHPESLLTSKGSVLLAQSFAYLTGELTSTERLTSQTDKE